MKVNLTVERANEIQAAWMALDSNGPQEEKERVYRLMKELPSCYISQSDSDKAQVIMRGMPCHAFTESKELAEKRAKSMGVQTAIRWNCKGIWEKGE